MGLKRENEVYKRDEVEGARSSQGDPAKPVAGESRHDETSSAEMVPTNTSRSPSQNEFVVADAVQNPSDHNEILPVVPCSPTPPLEIQPIFPISKSELAELQESAPRSPAFPSEAQGVTSDHSHSSS